MIFHPSLENLSERTRRTCRISSTPSTTYDNTLTAYSFGVSPLSGQDIRDAQAGPERKRLAKRFRSLVKEHQILPSSILLNDIVIDGTHPLSGGGYSVGSSCRRMHPEHIRELWFRISGKEPTGSKKSVSKSCGFIPTAEMRKGTRSLLYVFYCSSD